MRMPRTGQASREFPTFGKSVRELEAVYLEGLAPLLPVLNTLCGWLTRLLSRFTGGGR